MQVCKDLCQRWIHGIETLSIEIVLVVCLSYISFKVAISYVLNNLVRHLFFWITIKRDGQSLVYCSSQTSQLHIILLKFLF